MEYFTSQLSKSYGNLIDKLSDWLNAIILQIPNIIIALFVSVIAYFLTKYIQKIAVKVCKKFTGNQTVLNLVSNLATVIFAIITLFLILSILNLSSTINKILATAGVFGLAVGLALQDPMNNLFSGVFLSVKDLYAIGDLVETNGYFGTITDIDLRVTKLRLPTGQFVYIPNKDVIQKPLKNFTTSGERRVDVNCGVSYGDDLEKVEKVVVKAIQKMDSILTDKPVDIVYNQFGDSSINFILRFWIAANTQRDYLVEQSKAIKIIKSTFDENDIMIPFPIRTLDFGVKGGVPLTKMITLNNGQSSNQFAFSTHEVQPS